MTPEPGRCRGCDRPVLFVHSENGATQVLDLKAPVYDLTTGDDGQPLARRSTGSYVSHFCTCSKASQFSGRNRR